MVILEVNNRAAISVEAFKKGISDAKRDGRDKVLVAVRIGKITNYRTIEVNPEG